MNALLVAVFLVAAPPVVSASEPDLTHIGSGVRRATILGIEVYRAKLFVKTPSRLEQVLSGSAGEVRVEVAFLRNVDRRQGALAWAQAVERGVALILINQFSTASRRHLQPRWPGAPAGPRPRGSHVCTSSRGARERRRCSASDPHPSSGAQLRSRRTWPVKSTLSSAGSQM